MTEENKEEILELSSEQLEEMLGNSDSYQLPPIEIGFEDYDEKEFKRGLNDASYLAGYITALFNAGISEAFVLDYLLNQETIKHNLDVAKLNKETSIEVSKNQKAVQEQYQL